MLSSTLSYTPTVSYTTDRAPSGPVQIDAIPTPFTAAIDFPKCPSWRFEAVSLRFVLVMGHATAGDTLGGQMA